MRNKLNSTDTKCSLLYTAAGEELAHDDVSQGCRSMLKTHLRRHNTPPIVEDAHKGHGVTGVHYSVLSVRSVVNGHGTIV